MGDILIVDDEMDIRSLISDILIDEGYPTRMAGTSDDAMSEISKSKPALMILDIWLKDSTMDGIDILKAVKRDNPDVPVVIISGHGNVEIAVAAIKQGAYDFIEKPFNIDQLLVVIKRAMETSKLRSENTTLKRSSAKIPELLGQSSVFKGLRSQLDKVTKSNGRVLLTGPSGAGKELAAHYIHALSNRADSDFVTVNCATLRADTMDETLFGKMSDGAQSAGLLQKADGGILFLDEIGELPADTQSKLLRVLVDQSFQPVGSSTQIKVDFRVISATTKNLQVEIAEGRFREELFHRLNVVPIEVPGLQERREDIPVLAQHFLSVMHSDQGLPSRALSEDSIAMVQSMVWPGNVRQLRNVMERVLILGQSDGDIEPEELPTNDAPPNSLDGRIVLSGALASLSLREARELFEREYLLTQINRFGGNISRTASFVGMERSALHRKLKSLGVITSSRSGGRVARVEGDETA
ncbi:MAG: sigma-54-dependent transcriptional regulator [Planktomarina sp.]